jgi:adenylate cyclase
VTRAELVRRMVWRLGPAMLLANTAGAVVVYVFLVFLLPGVPPGPEADRQRGLNTAVFLAYMVFALAVGTVWSLRRNRPLVRWLAGGRPAGPDDRMAALRAPLRQLRVHAVLWLVAALLFGALNVGYSVRVALDISGTVVLGGFTTCALGHLLEERLLRPVVTFAMVDADAPPPVLLGVTSRVLLSWALGTVVPLLGIVIGLLPGQGDRTLSRGGVLFLLGVGLVAGLLAMVAAARAVSDPVRSVGEALTEVGAGRFDAAVPVYDASEVGRLQAGFNAMAAGLRERERERDLFGRSVGPEVAQLVREQGVTLTGERRDVAVLFVDVVGSTGLAEQLGPEEVVARLNAFFAEVVAAVEGQGGWVNKFEGDAALCVFGAPGPLDDAPTRALAAARLLAERLAPLPLSAAVGVSAGPVVAGQVGAESRFEYTVVGDPVNAASRLTELAKTVPGRVLADADVVALASPQERDRWQVSGEQILRGRSRPTRLAVPRPR